MTTRCVSLALLILLAFTKPAAAGHPWSSAVLTIDAESLQQLAGQGRPVLTVDVRSPEAYQAGRLPGARSIPLTALTAQQRELPDDGLVVLYGADNVDEVSAAFRYLRSAGRTNVVVLEGGFAAWRAHGYQVERAPPVK
jgi:rhodanese-related sulfurtransferase